MVGPERGRYYDPYFMRTQFEIIQSEPVIEEVVRNLHLEEKLGKAMGYYDSLGQERAFRQTVKILSRALYVQQFRDTTLIEIKVSLSDPRATVCEDVATIANEIARVYRDQTMRRMRDMKAKALEALKHSLDELQKKVDLAEAEMERIRKEYQIDVISSQLGTDSSLEKIKLREMESQLIRLRLELETKKAKLDKVNSMSADDLASVGAYLVNDQALGELVAVRRRAEIELKRLSESSLGPKHPEVEKAQAAVNEAKAKVEEAMKGMRAAVQADYEACKAQYEALQKMVDEMKGKEREAAGTAYREFEKAKEAVEHARKMRDELEIRYNEEKVEEKIPRTIVDVIAPAQPADPDKWTSPDFTLNIIVSVLMGLVAGIAMAYFLEYLDTSVKTLDEIEKSMGISVIGVIPQKVKPFTHPNADPAHEEAYRVLRTNIRFSKKFQGGKTICITSGSVGEGKSLTLFNLAYVCAMLGDRTILVDSDLHRPKQHKMFGVANTKGLTNVLIGDISLEEAVMVSSVPNLDFLPSGRLQAPVHGLLDTARIKQIVSALKENYDMIFFDSPPVIGVSDASTIIREMDGVILVIQHRKYPLSLIHI